MSETLTSRRTPTTSHLAHESIKDRKEAMYTKIVAGLEKLRVGGNFEEIAVACNLESAQVWKRLSEMVDAGIVFNVGITRETSSGRKAMVRQLSSLRPRPMFMAGQLVKQAELFTPTHTPEEQAAWDLYMDN
jgi:hypothetical protein